MGDDDYTEVICLGTVEKMIDPTIDLSNLDKDEEEKLENPFEETIRECCRQDDILNLSFFGNKPVLSDETSILEESWTTAITDFSPGTQKAIVDDSVRLMYDIQKLKKLTEFELFNEGADIVREDLLKDHLMKGGSLEESAVLQLIRKGVKVLKCEENILSIKLPVIISGDIQGRLDNCLEILKLGGSFIETNQRYLFLGNYTNTQKFSMEALIYLWALKINHGSRMILLRGKNETRLMSAMIRIECETKYSPAVYEAWMSAFDSLPLVAIVNRQFFCVHGGLSESTLVLRDVKNINRFREPLYDMPDPLSDLLWSHPREDFGHESSADILFTKKDFAFSFSYTACCNFLRVNHLIGVINGDQPLGEGFKLYRLTEKCFPSLISVYSAPNKSGIVNKAAILRYEKLEKFLVKQFP